MICGLTRPRVRRSSEHVTLPTARGRRHGARAQAPSGTWTLRADDQQDHVDRHKDRILQRQAKSAVRPRGTSVMTSRTKNTTATMRTATSCPTTKAAPRRPRVDPDQEQERKDDQVSVAERKRLRRRYGRSTQNAIKNRTMFRRSRSFRNTASVLGTLRRFRKASTRRNTNRSPRSHSRATPRPA